jgi:hypothetical protein
MRGLSTFSISRNAKGANPLGGTPLVPRARASAVQSEAAEPTGTHERRRMVIVPRRPALLREYEATPQRPRDELDDFIDELFGATTDEKPGRFDAALVVVGLVLAIWATILSGPAPALWLGIAAIVLGLALPVRAALRAYGWSRTGGLRRRILDGGLLLDASHPATVALIDAYAHLIQLSCLQGTGDPKRSVTAGHMAVVEVATQLDGQPPETPAKIRFVTIRSEAVEALTRQMLRSHDRWAAKTAVDPLVADEASVDQAVASRWESLNALTRTGALAEMEMLSAQLRRETADEAD